MALTVAPRDVLWQSVNVTLATKRILLLFYLKKFSPHFLRQFNKELKKRTWEASQKNVLSVTLLPPRPQKGAITASLQHFGACLGKRNFHQEKPAYHSSSKHKVFSIMSTAKHRQ